MELRSDLGYTTRLRGEQVLNKATHANGSSATQL